MIDRGRLPGEIEGHAPLRAGAVVGVERARLFLRDPDDHHTVLAAQARAVRRDDRVFVLPDSNSMKGTV